MEPEHVEPRCPSRPAHEYTRPSRNFKARRRAPDEQPSGLSLLRALLLSVTLSTCVVQAVVVYKVSYISRHSARTDYALAGESLELSCHYLMKDEAEDVRQLVWSKDGRNFLRWSKHKPGLEVHSYTFKGHIDHSSAHSRLLINNVTIAMHGKYKCAVKTDLNSGEAEQQLNVVSAGQCKLSDWRVTSEQMRCRELFRLDCRSMFPRPVPSCGLWNTRSDKFIRSVSVDISEEPALGSSGATAAPTTAPPAAASLGLNSSSQLATGTRAVPLGTRTSSQQSHWAQPQTYRVRYVEKFELTLANGSLNPQHADLLPFAGHLMLKCDIVVPGTSWRLSMRHRMFDYADGCNSDPLEMIGWMRAKFSRMALTRLLKQRPDLRDDAAMEMLADHLHYEILPPPQSAGQMQQRQHPWLQSGNKANVGSNSTQSGRLTTKTSSQQQALNCWQKPRVGSIARLSCVPPPAKSTAGIDHAPSVQVKLRGTSLLECKRGGWVPVRATSRSSSGPRRAVRRGQQEDDRSNTQQHLIGNYQYNDNYNHQDNQNNHNNHDNEDNDDDNDDDNSAPMNHRPIQVESVSASSLPSTTPPDELAANEIQLPSHDESHNDTSSAHHAHPLMNDERALHELTPSELAALLPNCVSVSSGFRHQQIEDRTRHQLIYKNRLPLMEAPEDGAKVLEFDSTNNQRQRDGYKRPATITTIGSASTTANDQQWYSFFVTSSTTSSSPTSATRWAKGLLCLLPVLFQNVNLHRSHYFSTHTIVSITTTATTFIRACRSLWSFRKETHQ